MTVITDIFGSYFSPISVFKKRILHISDSQLFGILIIGCLITLIGQFPDIYIQAISSGDPLVGIFSASLVAIMLIFPLVFYVFSGVIFVVFKIFQIKINNFYLRLAFFWSFTLVSPFGLILAIIRLVNVSFMVEAIISILIFIVFLIYFCLFLRVCILQSVKGVRRS